MSPGRLEGSPGRLVGSPGRLEDDSEQLDATLPRGSFIE